MTAPADPTAPAAYVICTAPRSGSTLLCGLLAATGVAGAPKSWFHKPSVAAWARALGLETDPAQTERDRLAAVVAAARRAGAGGTGIFGLRLQAHSLDFFRERLAQLHPEAASDRARIEAAFGPTRFIHLHRADTLAQAISHLKATQTGLWHAAPDGREIERLAPPAPPVYDPDAIRERIAQMEGWDRKWDGWFAREGIAPLRLDYARLSDDPRGTLRAVLADLGRDPDRADAIEVPTRKLADATSRAWAERFRAGTGAA